MLLLLVACTGTTDVSNKAEEAVPQEETAAVVNLDKFRAISSNQPLEFLTVNVRLTDDGFQPASISIPAGQRVKLVVRNHGKKEHHYRIVGLVPADLLWRLSAPKSDMVTDEDEDDHFSHHLDVSYVPYRSASGAGIRPTGDEVHAFAAGGALDVLFFTATNAGTFEAQDPLHPEIVGQVTVLAPPTQ